MPKIRECRHVGISFYAGTPRRGIALQRGVAVEEGTA